MRVLQLCLSPNYGGLEGHVRDFARWLIDRPGIDLVLALREESRLARALEPLGCSLIPFPRSYGKVPLRAGRCLARLLDDRAVDVVHLHWKDDLPLAVLAKRLARRNVALVHTRHMNMPGKKRDPYHTFLYRSLDRLIVVTHYLRRQVERHVRIDPSRISVVHNGCAPETEVIPATTARRAAAIGLDSRRFNVGLFGRISEYKGQHLLIEAVDRLRERGRDVVGWIIGEPFEPAYLESLRRKVADRRLQDHVRFVGFQERPQELMPAFDVVTLTTKNETFGLVLIEAMRAGVAVIGSDEGGVPEIIDDGRTGLLFRSWDAADLAGCIERLHGDAGLRKRLAHAGRAKALECFDRDRQYAMVEKLLRESTAPVDAREAA